MDELTHQRLSIDRILPRLKQLVERKSNIQASKIQSLFESTAWLLTCPYKKDTGEIEQICQFNNLTEFDEKKIRLSQIQNDSVVLSECQSEIYSDLIFEKENYLEGL